MPEYVIGLEDAKRDLLGLAGEIARDLFPDALKAGGDVIEQELEARTPEGKVSTSTKEYGPLRDDLDTAIEIQGLTGSAKVGFGQDKGWVARLVEFGHRDVTHKGKQIGEVKAHPFMRTSADTAADDAVEAFADSLGKK
jgi:HK97 gp10 family phage protein